MNSPDSRPSTHLHTAPLTDDEPPKDAPRNTSSFFRARRPQVSTTLEPPRANAPLNQPSFFSRTPAATASQSGFAPAPFLPTQDDREAFDRFRQSARPIQRLFLGRTPQNPASPEDTSTLPADLAPQPTDAPFPFAAAPAPIPSDLSGARPGPDAEIWNPDFGDEELLAQHLADAELHRQAAAQHTGTAFEEATRPAATVRHYAPVKMIELTDSGLRRNPLRSAADVQPEINTGNATIRTYDTVEMPTPEQFPVVHSDHSETLESTTSGPLDMIPHAKNGPSQQLRSEPYTREPVNQYVDTRPETIETDDELIIPVIEEVVIVQRRLLHRENIRIPRRRD